MKKVSGIVKHVQLEGNFWGIISKDGTRYEVIDMPEQLKYPEVEVTVKIKKLDVFSIHMWGTPCKIVSFQTLQF